MDLTIFFTVIGGVVTTIGFVYGFLRNFKIDMLNQLDRMKADNQQLLDRIDRKMDNFDEKLTDIARRLCRMEGAFSSKDCCILKEDKQTKKAE